MTVRAPIVTISDRAVELPAADVTRGMPTAAPSARRLASGLPRNASGGVITAAMAYWVYVGQLMRPVNLDPPSINLTAGGSGTFTAAELGYATSPAEPAAAGQTLTVLRVGALANPTTSGLKTPSAWATTPVTANGLFLWTCVRIDMVTTPMAVALFGDHGAGNILVTAASGALVAGNTYAGVLPAESLAMSPDVVGRVNTLG